MQLHTITDRDALIREIEANWDRLAPRHRLGNAAGYRLDRVWLEPTGKGCRRPDSNGYAYPAGDRPYQLWRLRILHRGMDLAHRAADPNPREAEVSLNLSADLPAETIEVPLAATA